MYDALIYILYSLTSKECVIQEYKILCPQNGAPWCHCITVGMGEGRMASSSMQVRRLFSMPLPAAVVGSPVVGGRELPNKIQAQES